MWAELEEPWELPQTIDTVRPCHQHSFGWWRLAEPCAGQGLLQAVVGSLGEEQIIGQRAQPTDVLPSNLLYLCPLRPQTLLEPRSHLIFLDSPNPKGQPQSVKSFFTVWIAFGTPMLLGGWVELICKACRMLGQRNMPHTRACTHIT